MSGNLAERPKDSSLFDIPGCTFTPTGLLIEHGLSFNSWERLGEVLKNTGRGVQFWLGDWIQYGEAEYGHKYAQAIETTGRDYQTLADGVYVASNVDFSLRNEKLSFNHHRAVASLKPAQQRKWLAKADVEDWSYRELRKAIEDAKREENFKLTGSVLDKVWERIQDGCYTPEAVLKCGECGKNMFDLDADQIKLYMQQLVDSGKAEWRKQGGKTDVGRGEATTLCVPKDLPAGSDFDMPGYHPVVEYGDDKDEHF